MGNITDKVNGWGNGFGVWFRFITPFFLGLLLWNFTTFQLYVKESIADLKLCFSNHLVHHANNDTDRNAVDKQIEHRLTEIETLLRKK